jgi:pimeloyl-ACP methyl ester carboxylesterase
MTGDGITRQGLAFPSGNDRCSATLYLPRGVEKPPVVILGHGLGATRDMGLDAYAARFAEAGIAALTFTYRYFGDSTGQPRQLLSIRRQLADWDAALAHVQSRKDVDTSRVAVWGSSFGGGHAIVVAARHPELAAAIAQCPFTDGLASARALGPAGALRLVPVVLRDLLAMLRRAEPAQITVAGPPGSVALMTAPDALPGYLALVPAGGTFTNHVAARVAPTITAHRPGRRARTVRPPILFCICNHDSVTPPEQTLRYARTAPRGEIKTYPTGHFDIYRGEQFEAVVADQIDFLQRHLKGQLS